MKSENSQKSGGVYFPNQWDRLYEKNANEVNYMDSEGKRIFTNSLKKKMVDAIKSSMSCNFHVEIDSVSEIYDIDCYHEDTTFVNSHKTPIGELKVFHYYKNQDLLQVMVMDIYPCMFAVKHVLEKARSIALPPILNFKAKTINSIGLKFFKGLLPLEQIEMTKDEYKSVMPWYKEFHYSECQTYRFRTVEFVDGINAVFLIDSKIHPVPAR